MSDIWQYLSDSAMPLVVYGMGDGADKLFSVLERCGLRRRVVAVIASDDFVRGQSCHGFIVKKLSDVRAEQNGEPFTILLAFGTRQPEVLDYIYALCDDENAEYELYAPDLPVAGDTDKLFDANFYTENMDRIDAVRDKLCDDWSKFVFDSMIDYKLTGAVDYLRDNFSEREETLSLLGISGAGTDTFVDLGAFDGDTVEEFLWLTDKNFNKIYALEPDERNFLKLRRRHYALGSGKFVPINAAASYFDGVVPFDMSGGRHGRIGADARRKSREIIAKRVDTICAGDTVSYIKLDVEGAEAAALEGAALTIARDKPVLHVAAYHRFDDLIALPELILRLNPEYRLFLRRQECLPGWELNIIAVNNNI